jgi:hypothetical protein
MLNLSLLQLSFTLIALRGREEEVKDEAEAENAQNDDDRNDHKKEANRKYVEVLCPTAYLHDTLTNTFRKLSIQNCLLSLPLLLLPLIHQDSRGRPFLSFPFFVFFQTRSKSHHPSPPR